MCKPGERCSQDAGTKGSWEPVVPALSSSSAKAIHSYGCRALRPKGKLRKTWDGAVLCVAGFSIICEPLSVAFQYERGSIGLWCLVRLYMDIFFVVDIVMNSLTGSSDQRLQESVNLDAWVSFKHYARGHLLFDMAASLPWDYILKQLLSTEFSVYLGLFRLLRLARSFRAIHLHVCSGLRLVIVQLICIVMLALHSAACLLVSLATPSELHGRSQGMFELYSMGLLQALALVFHVGDLHLLALPEDEHVVSSLIISFVGAGLLTMMISVASACLWQPKHSSRPTRCTEANLSLWGGAAREALDILPTGLRKRLQMHMIGPELRASPLFVGPRADYGFVSSILPILDSQSFTEGHWIFRANELPRQVYFLVSGNVQLIAGNTSQRTVSATLAAGAMLGQEAFLLNTNHLFTALCLTHCDCMLADGKRFFDIGTAYPDTLAFLQRTVHQQISFFMNIALEILGSDATDPKAHAAANSVLQALKRIQNGDDCRSEGPSDFSPDVASEWEGNGHDSRHRSESSRGN
eukprot:gnl/MRDRNA2_/MRDRNA2_57096_c0_seq1.p1 gnl/MRDRNA2_/MRDRNA2_57096_c0~~gnl/MRDRNA2_/MRDRNA2_57096_c0_seq1.p1  ORF type:complete len:523 (+),score=81.87 gnl/MRDRNA2_/MRDRNA2_57096_c0_seq1:72-1640(+)